MKRRKNNEAARKYFVIVEALVGLIMIWLAYIANILHVFQIKGKEKE